MLKKSSIRRNAQTKQTQCWVCDSTKPCNHLDTSVNGYLCTDCWQDALAVDNFLANPIYAMRHPEPGEFPDNYREFPPGYHC